MKKLTCDFRSKIQELYEYFVYENLEDSENIYLLDTENDLYIDGLETILDELTNIDKMKKYVRDHANKVADSIVENANDALKRHTIEEFANENFSGNVDLENENVENYVTKLMDLFRIYHYSAGDLGYYCDASDIPTTKEEVKKQLENDEKNLRDLRGLSK